MAWLLSDFDPNKIRRVAMLSRTLAPALLALAALSGCTTVASTERPAPAAQAEQRVPVTILVSIDGFRADYLQRGVTPNLAALASSGVEAPMRPSFPTKTFPNHWAIVTGDRPDRNGIVANNMEDAARPDEKFTMASDDPFWWNDVEPIWVTAEKAGVRTATMFWPGSNVPWGGTQDKEWPRAIHGGARPQDWAQFNQQIGGTQRVNAGTFAMSNHMGAAARSAAGISVISQQTGLSSLVQQSVNVQANLNVR